MQNDIIIALISFCGSIFVAIISLVGVISTNKKSNKDIERKLEIAQAVTDTKIEELTREVREHNNFAKRMPVVESEIVHIESDIKDLKKYHEGK